VSVTRKYDPTAINRRSPSIARTATSVIPRAALAESHSRSTIASDGSPGVKNRLYRDSGDRSWKKRRMASRSSGPVVRTVATDPSRSTRRSANGSSTTTAGVDADRMVMSYASATS